MGERRSWTDAETNALADVLEELVVPGHRVDAGQFRPGSISMIVAKMASVFPNGGISANHIRNKIKRLKVKFNVAADMANTSRFGWNSEKHCVEVDSPDILAEYVKKFPNRTYVCGRPFPLYPKLQFIFDHDRATGADAETPEDALENMQEEVGDTVMVSAVTIIMGCPSAPATTATTTPPTSRAANEAFMVSSSVGRQHMETLANAIGGKDATRILREELKNLGLTAVQVVKVVKKMSKHQEYASYFWDLDVDQKREFMDSLLGADK
ncbi:hypothetical protein Tsubulata_039086 [Turnera subulata]|uniref:Myb/SANT-like domain-containing protein n=1 Tax=Turnera subulata TaxID=218843 RepID=A0A9Q0F7Q8_9ROSI|nr:hypothetical protein Tsubulata_039086 [Turnera subulata]